MQAWWQFYAALGTSAAALLGLLFVAVSINAQQLLGKGRPGSRHLAEQGFRSYVTVISVSLLALFPNMSLKTFSLIALILSTSSAFLSSGRIFAMISSHVKSAKSLPHVFRRLVSSIIGYGLLIFATVEMALGRDDARNTLAAAMLILAFSATLISWDLLLGMARAKDSGEID